MACVYAGNITQEINFPSQLSRHSARPWQPMAAHSSPWQAMAAQGEDLSLNGDPARRGEGTRSAEGVGGGGGEPGLRAAGDASLNESSLAPYHPLSAAAQCELHTGRTRTGRTGRRTHGMERRSVAWPGVARRDVAPQGRLANQITLVTTSWRGDTRGGDSQRRQPAAAPFNVIRSGCSGAVCVCV